MEQRLGRGLDSLISSTVEVDSQRVWEVPLDRIRVNPRQPRQIWNEEALEELARSIKLHGVLQPILIRRSGSGFELIAGERRFRASRIAGLTTIPAHETDAEGLHTLELALIENVQREDLNALDEAAAYRQLLRQSEMTHQELADRVGKKRATISNCLRLLDLPQELQELVSGRRLSAGQARALLGLKDKTRMVDLGRRAAKEGWPVREVERRARMKTSAKGPRARGDAVETGGSSKAAHYEEQLRNLFGTKTSIIDEGGRGEVRLAFYSAKDRDRLLHQLLTSDPAP